MADIGGYNFRQMPNFTPEQMELFKSQFQHLMPGSFTSRLAGGDQSLFDEMEAPAMKQFGQMQGQLGSRFSGMGMGARRGSGFKNTMNQATSDFASQLQQQRMGLQRNAIQDLMGMSNTLLGQKPYENFLQPKKKSFLETLFTEGLPVFGQAWGQSGGQGQQGSMGGQGGGADWMKLAMMAGLL
jgi:hypothetical protein